MEETKELSKEQKIESGFKSFAESNLTKETDIDNLVYHTNTTELVKSFLNEEEFKRLNLDLEKILTLTKRFREALIKQRDKLNTTK
jgi:hypothetical protein